MNRQDAKKKRIKSNCNRQDAKGTQRKTESEVLCGFSLRLRAFAVNAFLCVFSASLRLCGCGFSSFHGVLGALAV
jgi:hypothetical protein